MNQEQINKLRKVCKNISVLYVEDDKNISIQVERLLKKIFLDVEVEKNGFLGLANFTQNRQDIVITDISMPVMDGIEMAKEIKNLNSEQNILVTSAHNDVEYLIELIEIGIDRFVAKPIDINSFFVNISKIAVGIYREKREALMEYRLKMQQDLQKKILSSVAFPMVYFEGDKIVYANSNFKKHFYTEIDANDADRFRLGYLFDEKKFVTMSNATVLDEIEEATNKIYLIMDVGEKIVKKYNINISNLQEKNHRLVGFINLDDINVECERFRTQVDYFPKREAFLRATLVQRNKSEENYLVFCVGLKNTKRFIDRYGGVKMHTIYTELARYLKREFEEEVEGRMLFIFLFETNRYIFLADKKVGKAVEKKLEAFGKKYSYEYGSRLALELNCLKEEIAHATPTTDVAENAEGMLYTFDD